MENFFYRVKPLDTLKSLSIKFEIPMSLIIYLNQLKEEISAGDVLFLSKPSGNIYRIRPLDTAYTVAKKFGVSIEDILDKNKTPYLAYGDILII